MSADKKKKFILAQFLVRNVRALIAMFPTPVVITFVPAVATAVLLAGCVPYPIYKTLQPSARVTVFDAASQPIGRARVTLISNSYPYGREKSRESKETDGNGVVSFEARSEWRTEVFFIHGAEVFFWNWCIEQPGFVTHSTANSSPNVFVPELAIRLEAGESKPCPNPYR